MPEHVVRHKNKAVLPYVLSVPEGATDADVAERVAALGPDWSLDKKTDPADVPPVVEVPTVSAKKES